MVFRDGGDSALLLVDRMRCGLRGIMKPLVVIIVITVYYIYWYYVIIITKEIENESERKSVRNS